MFSGLEDKGIHSRKRERGKTLKAAEESGLLYAFRDDGSRQVNASPEMLRWMAYPIIRLCVSRLPDFVFS
jgi:hypothetical protein